MYDYIIIGAGIAGLYFGYRLKKLGINNFIIIDKNAHYGGRAFSYKLRDTKVQLGAGVLDKSNTHLLKLMSELGLEAGFFKSKNNYIFDNADEEWYHSKINLIKTEFNKLSINQQQSISVFEFLSSLMSSDDVHRFFSHSEYTDYHNASLYKFYYEYPIDDIDNKEIDLGYIKKGDWQALVNKLKEDIEHKILLNTHVVSIKKGIVKTTNIQYNAKKIILCADIGILSCLEDKKIFTGIKSTPFVRMYTYHDEHNLENHIINNSVLHRMIKINKNIIMSAYSDSCNAVNLKKIYDESNNFLVSLNTLIQSFIKDKDKYMISPVKTNDDYVLCYWKHGIHYYTPKYNNQKAYIDGEFFIACGEWTSHRQGWVEGAIQSVNSVFTDFVF